LIRRRDFSFGMFLLYQSPRGCSFESVLTESGDAHRSEHIGDRVQRILPLLDE